MDTVVTKGPAEIPEVTNPLLNPSPVRTAERPVEEDGEKRTVAVPDNESIAKLTGKIQEHLDNLNINIAFSTYGEKDRRTSVVVMNKETGEVIRELPPKELQRLHVKMEELLGMIFNDLA